MGYIRDYRDNTVDLANGAAFGAEGVTKFKHPYLAYAAEKVGGAAMSALGLFVYLHPAGYSDSKGKFRLASRVETHPRTRRIAGGIIMAASLSFTAVNQVPNIAEAASNVTKVTEHFTDAFSLEPLVRLGRG